MRLKCPTDKYDRNLYQCAPNEYKTDLVEFCLKESTGRYEEGLCVFAYPSRGLHVDNCSMFESGCPENSYISDEIYKYPACLKINRDAGCYVADPTCLPSGKTPVTLTGRLDNVTLANTRFTSPAYSNPQDSVNVIATVVSLLLAIILVIVIVFGIIMFFLHRRRMRKKRGKGYKEKEEEEVFDRGTLLDVTMNTAEDEVIERGTMLDVGDPEDINESSTGSNLVYVVEGQEQSEQDQVPGIDPYLRILVVVFTSSISERKLLSEAQEKFGPGCKLLSVSSYQEQSREKYETVYRGF